MVPAVGFEGANKTEKTEIKVFAKGSFAKPPEGRFLKFIFPMPMIRYAMVSKNPELGAGFNRPARYSIII